MHEYSVVTALMEKIETIAIENQATAISKVIVKIGVMSGIEPHLLEIAFHTFKEKTICDQAAFIMNIQPVVVLCKKCQTQSELEKHHYICPICNSHELQILDGEDMLLMSLELETAQ